MGRCQPVWWMLAIAGLIGLWSVPLAALAHQAVTAGAYSIEYGWLNEPAVAGQPNAVILNIAPAAGGAAVDVDVSGLQVQVAYGGQSKVLALQPLGEATPGQFLAPLTPMRAGGYTLKLSGQLGGAGINVEVQPEAVDTADVVQFPAPAAPAAGGPDPLALGALAAGGLGSLLGGLALLRRK